MGWSERVRAAWQGLAGVDAAGEGPQRKTMAMPTVWSPVVQGMGWPGAASGQVMPKPTMVNLRRFAGDSGGEAGDQLHQGSNRLHGLADRGEAECRCRRRWGSG